VRTSLTDPTDIIKFCRVDLDRLDGSRLKLLYELSHSFAAHAELEELLTSIVGSCHAVFGPQANCGVLLVDDDTGRMYFPRADAYGVYPKELRDVPLSLDAGLRGAIFKSGRAELIVDAPSDPRYDAALARKLGLSIGSILAAPLVTRRGPVGLLTVAQPSGEPPYGPDDLLFLESLASFVATAIENSQMYARLKASESDLRLEIGALQRGRERRDPFPEIVGASPALRELLRLMESAAASSIAVLIEGETGTGKELVAQGIHRASARGKGPFLAVNCGAFTESLLESELFGHERGAFTGAERAKRGLLEALSGGTILLDEVGEMPPAMQVKLLRVLQEREIVPVGSTSGRPIDVRVISASNRSLEAEVAAKRFRADLYYRLAGFPIRVPPLSERREDIAPLTDHLLDAAARSHRKSIAGIAPDARAILERHAWPGNVRQLRNELERAVALAHEGDVIAASSLSETLLAQSGSEGAAPAPGAPDADEDPVWPATPPASLRDARAAFETRYIEGVLEREGGNVSRAAEALGISRVMLHKKLKALGLR
jgi:transcriptional regulator with GAF, ATPase, and Fis domain